MLFEVRLKLWCSHNYQLANRVHCFERSGMIVLRWAGAAAALSVYSLQLEAESKSPSGLRTNYNDGCPRPNYVWLSYQFNPLRGCDASRTGSHRLHSWLFIFKAFGLVGIFVIHFCVTCPGLQFWDRGILLIDGFIPMVRMLVDAWLSVTLFKGGCTVISYQ